METQAPLSEQERSSYNYFQRAGSPVIAEATASGGPVSIIRISGLDLNRFLPLLGGDKLPEPRFASYRSVASVDNAIVIYFKAPHSFTGEDVLEIQGHGISSIKEKIINDFLELGARRALPGEFSFRAYLNNKMSYEEVLKLNDALSDENFSYKKASNFLNLSKNSELGSMDFYEEIRQNLDHVRGRLECAIDFSEAEQEQQEEVEKAVDLLKKLEISLSHFLTAQESFALDRAEKKFVLVGAPNAGKSTLINILSGGSRALVSSKAGTTRDYIEVRSKISSHWVRFVDTAGIRLLSDAEGVIEEQGITLGLSQLHEANALIWVRRLDRMNDPCVEGHYNAFNGFKFQIFSHKDQVSLSEQVSEPAAFDFNSDKEKILSHISSMLSEYFSQQRDSQAEDSSYQLSSHQRSLLKSFADEIENARKELVDDTPIEVVADLLREASKILKKCVGAEMDENYISSIFSQFCLGK